MPLLAVPPRLSMHLFRVVSPAACAAVVCTAAAGTTASAQPGGGAAQGVLVRLEPGGQPITDVPRVVLTPTGGGPPLELVLADDGQPPDVAEADGRWAGVATTQEPSFTVELTVGGEVLDGGTVSWDDDTQARDLVLTLTGSGVVAQATAPGGHSAQGAPTSATPGTGGDPSSVSAATIPPAGGLGTPSQPGASSSTAADDGWLWVALGLGALSLVGGLVLALRGGSPPSRALELERAPQPPVFGPGTPVLQRGLHLWTVSADHRLALLPGLLQALARHHRVLLVLPSGAAAPAVFGGPVFVVRDPQPSAIEGVLVDLDDHPGLPLVVVVVSERPQAAWLDELAALMDPDPAALVLATEAPAGRTADAELRRLGDAAQLVTDTDVVALEQSPDGYRPAAC